MSINCLFTFHLNQGPESDSGHRPGLSGKSVFEVPGLGSLPNGLMAKMKLEEVEPQGSALQHYVLGLGSIPWETFADQTTGENL